MRHLLRGFLTSLLLCTPALAQLGPINSSTQVATSGNVAAGIATATLPAVAGRTTILTEIQITAGGATAAVCVNATVTGLVGGTPAYAVCAPAGVAAQASPLIITFGDFGLPAAGQGVAIVVSLPSLGAGNTNAVVNVTGYYQ